MALVTFWGFGGGKLGGRRRSNLESRIIYVVERMDLIISQINSSHDEVILFGCGVGVGA